MKMGFRLGVFLDADSLGRDVSFGRLEPLAENWHFHPSTQPGQTAQRIREADLVITNKVVLDADLLAGCDQLRLVCIAATGTNNIDLAAARIQAVAVTNVTAYATPSVVQHVFALLLNLVNRINEHRQAVLDGNWTAASNFCLLDYPFGELSGKTLGIIGYGELGRAVARVAAAFGMQVLVAQRPGSSLAAEEPALQAAVRLPMDDLLAQSDVVSLHVPLAENTCGLIGAAQLQRMKTSAILINTARGGVVDEAALLQALETSQIAGAALDVLEQEPPPLDNPLLSYQRPNLLITPHVAWASRECRQRMLVEIAANIEAFSRGESRNRVD